MCGTRIEALCKMPTGEDDYGEGEYLDAVVLESDDCGRPSLVESANTGIAYAIGYTTDNPDERPGEVSIRVRAAAQIRPYEAPQWLIEVVRVLGSEAVADLEHALLTRSAFAVEPVIGWAPYCAIVRVAEGEEYAMGDYLIG